MAIQVPRVLLTGDYWHADFQALIASSVCVTTLVPVEKICEDHLSDPDLDLVILAASLREQFSAEWVESIRAQAAPTPTVVLLGTWCEGELRSGEPWPGVNRVYWHQWRGRFEYFIRQLNKLMLGDWHLPATANQADVVEQLVCPSSGKSLNIGVSAVSDEQYRMAADVVGAFGGEPCWIEKQQWDAQVGEELSAIIVDADTWNQSVRARVDWLRDDLEIDAPIVLLLNFPRQSDTESAFAAGISEIVSKPFQIGDVALAIERAIGKTQVSS